MRATKYGRLYYQLVVKMHRTKGQGFSLLPTPMAKVWGITPDQIMQRKEKYGGEMRGLYLEHLATLGMLPTPVATDYKVGYQPSKMMSKIGHKRKNLLRALPTRIGIYKNPEDGKISQLNPLFVEEMMGYPENYTALPFLNGNKKP